MPGLRTIWDTLPWQLPVRTPQWSSEEILHQRWEFHNEFRPEVPHEGKPLPRSSPPSQRRRSLLCRENFAKFPAKLSGPPATPRCHIKVSEGVLTETHPFVCPTCIGTGTVWRATTMATEQEPCDMGSYWNWEDVLSEDPTTEELIREALGQVEGIQLSDPYGNYL